MAIGDWSGEEMPVRELGPIPPDPEDMNDARSEWAKNALESFQDETGTDDCDALADLLVDLMHLCDRDGRFEAFDVALDKAKRGYIEETLPFDEAGAIDWGAPIEWDTGEEAGFAPYDDSMPNHHVSACREWVSDTGDNYVAVGDDGEILGCEGEGYPTIRNVNGDEA